MPASMKLLRSTLLLLGLVAIGLGTACDCEIQARWCVDRRNGSNIVFRQIAFVVFPGVAHGGLNLEIAKFCFVKNRRVVIV